MDKYASRDGSWRAKRIWVRLTFRIRVIPSYVHAGCVLLTKVPRNSLRSPRDVRRTEVGCQRVHTSNLGL